MKRKFKNISKKGLIMTLCLIGIVLVLSIILMNSFSLPDQIGTISFQSKSLNYDNKEAGSFEITKSTRWISKGKARVEVNVDTISKIQNNEKDIILVLDTSFRDNLVSMKKLLIDFVEKILSNENSKIALVTYDTSSAVRVGFTKDKELLMGRINTLTTGLGKRNYYQALVSIDSLLKEYQQETKAVTTIFVTNGYSNVDIENEESYYQYLKEQYPYLNMNLVWYGESIDKEKQFGKISDKQYMTNISDLGIILLDIVDYTKEYERFILNDVIHTDYFDSNSISNIKTTNGIVNIEDDKLIWSLEEFHTGRSSQLTFDISLKETPSNEIKMVSTTKEDIVTYKLGELEETIRNKDNVKLPTNYQVIYESNKPNDCQVENLPSNEVRQVKEIVKLSSDLKCNGYGFKGWIILTEGVELLASNQFIMPESDVIVKAEWFKVSLEKTMDGEVLPGLPEVPVINSSKVGYPIITEYGVMIDSEVSIDFSTRDDINNYYSIDDGKTWKLYEGPFNKLSSTTIRAKSCLKDIDDDCIESSQKIEIPEDAVAPRAYDEDSETSVGEFKITSYLLVDKSMWEEKVYIYGRLGKGYKIELEDGTLVSMPNIGNNVVVSGRVDIVPNQAVRFVFPPYSPGNTASDLYEIRPDDSIVINDDNYYPRFTSSGINLAKNEVTIIYAKNSDQRLYRINNGEWQVYQDISVQLEAGDILQAKSVSRNGIEKISDVYTAKNDIMGIEAYDGNIDTYFRNVISSEFQSYYFTIDPSMWNKEVYVKKENLSGAYCGLNWQILDENNEVMIDDGPGCNSMDGTFTIPEKSAKIRFNLQGNIVLYEIQVVGIRQVIDTPNIQSFDMEGEKEISIIYPKNYKNEYSLDLGENWIPYIESIPLTESTTVLARSLNENGRVVSSSSFKTTTVEKAIKFSDAILKNNELIKQEPTFTPSNDNTSDPTGLYSSTDTNSGNPTYYFRGNVENNYVIFAGQLWRIIRINEDQTIRLITENSIGNEGMVYAFNNVSYKEVTSISINKDRMYYSSNANIKTTVDDWYNTNIKNTKYSNYVSSGNYFCEQAKVAYQSNLITNSGANMILYSSYKPNFKCIFDNNGKGIVNSNIGLISYDELLFSQRYNSWLNTSTFTDFWTMSPAGAYYSGTSSMHNSAYVWGWNTSSILRMDVSYSRSIRPVINLVDDTLVKGKGTSIDPYVVQ